MLKALLLSVLILPALSLLPGCSENRLVAGEVELLGAERVVNNFKRWSVSKKGKLRWHVTGDIVYNFTYNPVHAPEDQREQASRDYLLKQENKKKWRKRKQRKEREKKQELSDDPDEADEDDAKKSKDDEVDLAKLPPDQLNYDFVYEEDPEEQNVLLKRLFKKHEFNHIDLRQTTVIKNVHLKKYRKGKLETDLKARYGIMYGLTENIHLEGRVVIKSSDGRVLRTSYLNYNKLTDKLHTMAEVNIKSDQGILEGRGMVATGDLNWIQILGPSGLAKKKGEM